MRGRMGMLGLAAVVGALSVTTALQPRTPAPIAVAADCAAVNRCDSGSV